MQYFNLLAILYALGFSALLFSRLRVRPTFASFFGGLGLGLFGLSLVAETALAYDFNETWLKLWYFCFPLLALYGHGLLALYLPRKYYKLLTIGLGLGVLASAALIALTRITQAVDWYDPTLSVQLQYGDVLARNRPTRYLTWLFQAYALGAGLVTLGFSLAAIRQKKQTRSSLFGPLSVIAGVALVFTRGITYTAYGETIFYIVQLIIPMLLFWGFQHTFKRYGTPNQEMMLKATGREAA
ncbi:MAG: hypothetical protein JXB38_09390 [Anaerolineales bacterium]|nr:hypothetical protein [Anaerolineales bacterium]